MPVAAVTALDGRQVTLADGTVLTPDVVIAATGYRTGLDRLLGPLPVIDPVGRPTVSGARTHPKAPGLYFAGYTNPLNGALRQTGLDARAIARAIHGECKALAQNSRVPVQRRAARGHDDPGKHRPQSSTR